MIHETLTERHTFYIFQRSKRKVLKLHKLSHFNLVYHGNVSQGYISGHKIIQCKNTCAIIWIKKGLMQSLKSVGAVTLVGFEGNKNYY